MKKKIQAIVLAGGKGTRLAPLTDNCPKPLVPIHGRPMIEYVLDHLKSHNITCVSIAISHMGDQIKKHLGDGSQWGMEISYLVEPEPMGTGGWSQLVDWDALDDQFFVLNADNLAWMNLHALRLHHQGLNVQATIAGIRIPVQEHAAYEVLDPDEQGRLCAYIDRSICDSYLQGREHAFVSSGWYLFTPNIREHIPQKSPISNERDIWPALATAGVMLGFYHATEPWFDSGTHERLERVADFISQHLHIEKQV